MTRQRLPVTARKISSSVGLGVVVSSPCRLLIWSAVQKPALKGVGCDKSTLHRRRPTLISTALECCG